jgi:hypothetical protein
LTYFARDFLLYRFSRFSDHWTGLARLAADDRSSRLHPRRPGLAPGIDGTHDLLFRLLHSGGNGEGLTDRLALRLVGETAEWDHDLDRKVWRNNMSVCHNDARCQ